MVETHPITWSKQIGRDRQIASGAWDLKLGVFGLELIRLVGCSRFRLGVIQDDVVGALAWRSPRTTDKEQASGIASMNRCCG